MKKLLLIFGLISFAFISCRETPNPAPKTPPIDNPVPKPSPKTTTETQQNNK